ncbi:MAG: hypothetical protein M1819_006578 [Sarea resinae]|nr:MAG: hypothetical protein M1819_006578 [Sarea resinae]
MASTTQNGVPNGAHVEDHAAQAKEMEHSSTAKDLESPGYLGEKTATTTSGADFEYNFDVITNLIALFWTFFASTWTISFPNAETTYITEAFPTESNLATWITASHTISLCVVSAFIGHLSDIFGRKNFLILGPLLTIMGSLIAGRAHSLQMVVGGQVVNGIGFALGYLSVASIMELVPKNKRATVQMYSNVAASVAYIVGVLAAGGFIQHNTGGAMNGWRACFYLSAGFNFLAVILQFFFYHPSTLSTLYPGLSFGARLRKIDWIGGFLAVSGLTIFLVGLEFGNNPYKWDSATVLAPIFVGGFLIVVFALYEWLGPAGGLLDHRMFETWNFGLMMGLSWLSGIVLFGLPEFFPQLVTHTWSQKPVTTGVYSLPLNVAFIAGGFIGGLWVIFIKSARALITFSFVCILVGGGLLAVENPHINFAAWFFPTAIIGIGVGIQSTIMPVVATICMPLNLIGTATNVFFSSRANGGTVGVIILDVVFNSKLTKKLPALVEKATLAAGIKPQTLPALLKAVQAGSPAALEAVPGVTPQILMAAEEATMQAYDDSFRFVFYSLIAIAGAWSLIALLIRPIRDQLTTEIASPVTPGGVRKISPASERRELGLA